MSATKSSPARVLAIPLDKPPQGAAIESFLQTALSTNSFGIIVARVLGLKTPVAVLVTYREGETKSHLSDVIEHYFHTLGLTDIRVDSVEDAEDVDRDACRPWLVMGLGQGGRAHR